MGLQLQDMKLLSQGMAWRGKLATHLVTRCVISEALCVNSKGETHKRKNEFFLLSNRVRQMTICIKKNTLEMASKNITLIKASLYLKVFIPR